jgi:hypothetical protein
MISVVMVTEEWTAQVKEKEVVLQRPHLLQVVALILVSPLNGIPLPMHPRTWVQKMAPHPCSHLALLWALLLSLWVTTFQGPISSLKICMKGGNNGGDCTQSCIQVTILILSDHPHSFPPQHATVMNFFTRELQGSIENVRALFLSLSLSFWAWETRWGVETRRKTKLHFLTTKMQMESVQVHFQKSFSTTPNSGAVIWRWPRIFFIDENFTN